MSAEVKLSIDNQLISLRTLINNDLDANGKPIRKKLSKTNLFADWCKLRNLQSVIDSYNNGSDKNPPIETVSFSEPAIEYQFKCEGCGRSFPLTLNEVKDRFNNSNKNSPSTGRDKKAVFKLYCDICWKKYKSQQSQLHQGSLSQYKDDPLLGRIVDEWDANKNQYEENKYTGLFDLSIYTISSSYKYKVWWKCKECQTEYQASVRNRVSKTQHKGKNVISCPTCKVRYNSFAESTVYYYIKKLFGNGVIPNFRDYAKDKGISELDIFIPPNTPGLPEDYMKSGFAIEYNGYWHNNKEEKDAEKIENCQKYNIPLIVIKDTGDVLDVTTQEQNKSPLLVTYTYQYIPNSNDLQNIIKEIINKYLKKDFQDVNLSRDNQDIEQYRKALVLKKSFGGQNKLKSLDWDYDKNVITPLGSSLNTAHVREWICHICGAVYSQQVINRNRSNYVCPCIAKKSHFKNAKIYKLYHDTWDSSQDKVLLDAQAEFFDDKMKRDDFIKLINDTRNDHIAETDRKLKITHPTLNLSNNKVKNAYKD